MTIFEDILAIIGLDEDDVKKVKESGIKTFTNMKTLTKGQFKDALLAKGLDIGQTANMEAFRQWYREYRASPMKTKPVETVLTQDTWDEYLDTYDPDMARGPVANLAAANANPVKPTEAFKYKLETKGLPTLPKNETIQDKYNTWEEQFLAHIGMGDCDLTEILEDDYVIPITGDDLINYQKKDKLIKNAMMLATRDTHAYGFVDANKTGRDIFIDVRKAYRGKDHKAQKARDAFKDLHDLKFNRTSRLSPNAFVAKFLACLKEMALNGTPLWPELKKSTFLGKVDHPDYKSWVEVMEKSTDDFDETTLAFRDKASTLSKVPGSGPQGDRVTGKVQNAMGNENPRKKKNKKNSGGKAWFVKPEVWEKMSKEEKTKHYNKRKEHYDKKNDGETSPKETGQTNTHVSLPMQYNAQNNTFTVTDADGNVRSYSQAAAANAATVPTSNVNRAANFLQQSLPTRGGLFTASNVMVKLSTTVSDFVSLESNLQQVGYQSTMCVDGGTNISLMGRSFKITTWSNREADMCGFADGLVKTNVRIGSGVSVYEYNGIKLLIGLHEAPYLQENAGSLLSTGQAREYGVWINDVLARHGGEQRLCAADEAGTMVAIPFDVENGLFHIPLRYPTDDEMESLPIVWLTSNEVPWDPTVLDQSGTLMLPVYDGVTEISNEPVFSADCRFMSSENEDNLAWSDLVEEDRRQSFLACTIRSEVAGLVIGAFWLGQMVLNNMYRRTRAKMSTPDYEKYRPMLGWLPVKAVKCTFEAMTQLAQELPMRYPLRRHVRARFPQLNRRRLQETYATDTLFSSDYGLNGITCAQLFCGTKSHYTSLHGMKSESEGPDALEDFIRETGAPPLLRNDNAKMQTGNRWHDVLRKYTIAEETTEPHHPQQNPAEARIGEVKKYTSKIMDRTGAPTYLWFFCMLYVVYLQNRVAMESLNWRTPIEVALGETPDISSLLQFAFYEPVYYYDPIGNKFPDTKEKIGHFVGIAENKGDELTFWVLTGHRTVIARSVIRSALNSREPNKREGTKIAPGLEGSSDASTTDTTDTGEPKLELLLASELSKSMGMSESMTLLDPEQTEGFVFVREDSRGVPTRATVSRFDEEINKYLLKYGDDEEDEWVDELVIQEALLSRADDSAGDWLISKILGHRQDGNRYEVEILWESGETTWESMLMIKKEDPIKLATYAKENDLSHAQGWRWARRITDRPKKYARMLKIMKNQGKQGPRYKFGIELPRSRTHAMAIDKKNNNTYWQDAMKVEVDQLMEFKTFQVLGKGVKSFPNMKAYTYIPMHMVFDVKFDLHRKVRIVAGGNWTDPPDADIYSGVVSIESVRLSLFIAELNGLLTCAADVGNAFLHGYTKELIYTIAGPEFGPGLEGCIMIVERSLYGLKSSSAAFHEVLSDSLMELGFSPSKADFDLWMKDCGTHYEYIATWVDDLLIMSKDPMAIITDLKKKYTLKGVGTPEYYLGGDLGRVKHPSAPSGSYLVTSARTYIKKVCEKIEKLMDWRLKNYGSPMDPKYHPELDETPHLNEDLHARYQMMVGCMNWLVTLGRWDIYYATQTMARYSQAPREGHMQAMQRIYGYLAHFSKRQVVYDTRMPKHQDEKVTKYDGWKEMYPDATEEMPPGMPIPKGNSVRISAYFDADHAGCLQTRRSTSGMIMFLNGTPVKWYSKRQSTVESSTYGSEIVAGRISVEFAIEMRYKLRMLGVPIEGSCMLYGDNNSMILNTTVPSSMIKKKHNSIAYHRVREGVAGGVVDIVHVDTHDNIANILTKPLGPQEYYRLMKKVKFPGSTNEGELQDVLTDGSPSSSGEVIIGMVSMTI